MKPIHIALFLFSVYFSSTAQNIADVSVSSSGRVAVRDAKNNEISSKYLGINEEMAGFSSSIIVLLGSSGRVTVYNEKFQEISSKYLGINEKIRNVTGNYVILQGSNGRITTYDQNFREISSRYE